MGRAPVTDERLILVLDEGTTSTRALLYDPNGTVRGMASRPITQHYPSPGLVEHDAEEIWAGTLACAREMVELAGGADRIAAIGITNQRETVIAWDRATGNPLARAIVWQDRRTADLCAELSERGRGMDIPVRTGLRLDPYFSATKMGWLARQAQVAAAKDRLALGTIDSWLIFKLTKGAFVTDATNASRTLLLTLDGKSWDEEFTDLFDVPRSALAEVLPTAGSFGSCDSEWFGAPIPITAAIGDQQSATVGQGCLEKGQTKLTLGTGAFVLTSLDRDKPEDPQNLLGTILYDVGGTRAYALEGSIFVAGSLIKWMRDNMGLLGSAAESEAQARSVDDTGGVSVLPALAGLGAPYWRPNARAMIAGLTFSSTAAHVVRAALEAISHQCVDLAQEFARVGAPWRELRIDGGMSANGWLAQDLATMLRLAVIRPTDVETTARGAAMLAAVGAGIHADLQDAMSMLPNVETFEPEPGEAPRQLRLDRWHDLLKIAEVSSDSKASGASSADPNAK